VETYIDSPAFDQVYSQCAFTYSQTTTQRDDFSLCVSSETGTCRGGLSDAVYAEEAKAKSNSKFNQILVDRASWASQNCSTAAESAREMLDAWHSVGPLPYKDNSTSCSAQQKQQLEDLFTTPRVAPTAAPTVSNSIQLPNATALVLAYCTASQNLTTALSADIQNTQAGYVASAKGERNRTVTLAKSFASSAAAANTAAVNYSSNQMLSMVQTLIACVGYPSSTQVCTHGPSLRDRYLSEKSRVDQILAAAVIRETAVAAQMQAFASQVDTAMGKFAQFYYSVVGAGGLLGQLNSALTQLGITVNLCTLTNPSWCIFGPTSWTVSAPNINAIPQMPPLMSVDVMWNDMIATVT
jgi:hypothetical protein